MHKSTKVCVVGLGYIGLPTAALIASKGFSVLGLDVKPEVIEKINRGEVHIVEPDLAGLVKIVVDQGNLRASISPAAADVFLIAVPTPVDSQNGPDLKFIHQAASTIAPVLQPGNLVILESTSPIGTTEKLYADIIQKRPDLAVKIHCAYCPERVLPGKVIYELEHNDRVIGGIDAASTEKAVSFYQGFVKSQLFRSNARTAEMCKLVENAYRDSNIAFANELSMICEKADINVWDLIGLANRHPRVNILQPGPGVGGHCIAVDPWFIVSDFPQDAILIRNAREINLKKTDWVIEKIEQEIKRHESSGKKPTVAILGLSYKPDIDDLRESPSVEIYKHMCVKHQLIAVEPNIETLSGFTLMSFEESARIADIFVYLVPHKDFSGTHKKLGNKTVLDFCGLTRQTV